MTRCWDTIENRERRARAERLAERLDIGTINVALAYVLSQEFPVVPIIGPRDRAELAVALRATDVRLDAATCEWLNQGDPLPSGLSDL